MPKRHARGDSEQALRAFLKSSPAPQSKKYAIVMDNAPWHKKMYRLVVTEKLDEYADIRDNVEFIMLPPYSPDFNSIEQVWRITRRENTHNIFFLTLSLRLNQLLIMLFPSDILLIPNYTPCVLDCRNAFVVYDNLISLCCALFRLANFQI